MWKITRYSLFFNKLTWRQDFVSKAPLLFISITRNCTKLPLVKNKIFKFLQFENESYWQYESLLVKCRLFAGPFEQSLPRGVDTTFVTHCKRTPTIASRVSEIEPVFAHGYFVFHWKFLATIVATLIVRFKRTVPESNRLNVLPRFTNKTAFRARFIFFR